MYTVHIPHSQQSAGGGGGGVLVLLMLWAAQSLRLPPLPSHVCPRWLQRGLWWSCSYVVQWWAYTCICVLLFVYICVVLCCGSCRFDAQSLVFLGLLVFRFCFFQAPDRPGTCVLVLAVVGSPFGFKSMCQCYFVIFQIFFLLHSPRPAQEKACSYGKKKCVWGILLMLFLRTGLLLQL